MLHEAPVPLISQSPRNELEVEFTFLQGTGHFGSGITLIQVEKPGAWRADIGDDSVN